MLTHLREPLNKPHAGATAALRVLRATLWALLRSTSWHRGPGNDLLRAAPCDHPDFISNALGGGFVHRFLRIASQYFIFITAGISVRT